MSNSISTLLLRNLSDVFGENDSVRLHPGEGAEDGGAEGLTARDTRVGTGAGAFLRPGVVSSGCYRIISAILPLAINSASRAKSLYMTRSLSTVGHTDRIAACAA
jgi:hypothetical protein